MDIRSPLPPDDDAPEPAAQAGDSVGPVGDAGWEEDWESDEDASSTVPDGPIERASFRVPIRIILVKGAVAVLIALVSLLAPQRPQLVVGLVAAVGVAAYTARDLVARERLRADAEGVVAVRGYAGHRKLAWKEIEAMTVDSRSRAGARTNTLELDAGEQLFFFTRNDLGLEVFEALDILERVRATAEGGQIGV